MHSPFGGWRHHLSPASGGTITRAYCSATYERIALRSFIVPPLRGGRWCRKAPRGGKSHRRWLITVMLIMSYDTESKSRNADFILIARRAIPQPSARRAVKLKNLPAVRPVHLKNPHAAGVSKKRVQKKQCFPKKGSTVFLPAFMTISPASGQRSLFPFLLRPVLRTRRRRGSRTRCAIRRRWHRRCRRRQ